MCFLGHMQSNARDACLFKHRIDEVSKPNSELHKFGCGHLSTNSSEGQPLQPVHFIKLSLQGLPFSLVTVSSVFASDYMEW